MKQINNVLKTLLIIFSLIGFSANVWGKYDRSWKATVGVGTVKGKGTVSVQMYTKVGIEYSGDSQRTSSSKVSVYDSQSAYLSTSLIKHLCKYSVVSEDDGYAFAGWFSNEACTGNPESTQRTDWVGHSATTNSWDVTYWAKFIPVTVNSVTPSSSTLTFTKPETKSVTLTFNVSNADAKADFNTPTISNNEWTLTSWNYSNNQVTVVVSYTVTKDTSKDSDHAATITLTSKGVSDSQSQFATVRISMDMNPVFTCTIKDTYMVDDAALNLTSLWTSTSNGDITYSIESFIPSGTNNTDAKTPTIVNNVLSLGQAGELQLKLHQAGSVSYNEGDAQKTIIINKYDNKITITGFDDNEHAEHYIKTDWYDNEITLTATNTNYSARPIYYERTEGDDTQASFGVQKDNAGYYVVYTGQNTGIVSWRVWQEENYKYKGAENTFSVKVVSAPCGCVLKQETWQSSFEKAVSEIGEWDFGGIGETLSFELRSNFVAGNHMTYSLKTDDKYETPVKLKAESELYFTPVNTITLGEGDHNTTAVVFAKSSAIDGLNTDNPYVHNIVVTRKRWMKILDGAGKSAKEITSLPKMERFIDDDTVHVTFYVDFSTCDKLVKVASNYGHVTFKNNLVRDTISENTAPVTTRGYNDKVRVDLYYYSDVVEEREVTITIYTDYENKTLTVPVKTVGYIFKGGEGDDWTEPKNWNVGRVPNANHDVIIESNAVVNDEMAVHSMIITTGSVTIAPTGGLTVGAGGVKGANKDKLILQAGKDGETKGQTGYLRISPDYMGSMPEATVELFSIAYKAELFSADTRATWQYVGSPLVGGEAAKPIFKNSYIYNWNESTGEWENNRKTLVLHPFEGYATTQYKNDNGMLTTFAGQLADNQTKVIPLKYDEKSAFAGCNIVANSFTAPIDIAKMDLSDFSDGVEATIYIFNTGSSYQVAKGVAGAGQYTEIPVAELKKMAKGFSLPTVIPAMQGFLIKTTKAGSLTLDYSRIIMDDDERHSNTPLHAKRKNQETEEYFGTLRVSLEANGWRDFLYILESDEYVADYENGSDTHKMLGGTVNIFAMDGDDALGVDATNSIIGTRIGVRTADTTAYVMSFSHLRSDKELLLLDNETEQTIKINEGTEYSFFAQPNSMITDRFVIIEGEKAPEITTGLDSTMDDAKVHKFIKDNQLYILKNGVLYNAVGARVH